MIGTLCKYGEMKLASHMSEGKLRVHCKCRTEWSRTRGGGALEAQARGKATQGRRETGAEFRADSKKRKRRRLLSAPTPCSPRYVPREPTRYPQPQRDSGSHLLPCLFPNPSCELLPLASNQSCIHSCMRAFTQQMFTENGFWQESRFHLALEQGCRKIAKRK